MPDSPTWEKKKISERYGSVDNGEFLKVIDLMTFDHRKTRDMVEPVGVREYSLESVRFDPEW